MIFECWSLDTQVTEPLTTAKHCILVAFLRNLKARQRSGLPPTKSHNPLNKWPRKVMWQIKNITSSLTHAYGHETWQEGYLP